MSAKCHGMHRFAGFQALTRSCTVWSGSGLAADISLGAANGVRAVVYVQRQLAAMPQLRPLVLVVKAFLRQHNLNEARILLTAVCTRQRSTVAHWSSSGFE